MKISQRLVEQQVRVWVAKHGVRVGMLTLTRLPCSESDSDVADGWHRLLASGRWSSLYEGGLVVPERTARGVIHYHAVVVCHRDISTGSDVAEIRASRGRSGANDALRFCWREMRDWGAWGWGRNRLEPLLDSDKAAEYIASYLRAARGLRVRWVGCIRDVCANQRGVGGRPEAWRRGVGIAVDNVGEEMIREIGGPRWAFKLGSFFEGSGSLVQTGPREVARRGRRACLLELARRDFVRRFGAVQRVYDLDYSLKWPDPVWVDGNTRRVSGEPKPWRDRVLPAPKRVAIEWGRSCLNAGDRE